MKTTKTIHIITDTDYASTSTITPDNTVGFLFECAPDSQIALRYKSVFFVNVLLGDIDNHKKNACEWISKILDGEPVYEEVPQLIIYKETLITRLTLFFQMYYLHDYLLQQGFNKVVFSSASSVASVFYQICQQHHHSIQVVIPEEIKERKLVKRIKIVLASIKNKKELVRYYYWFLNKFDPFHQRELLSRIIYKKYRNTSYLKNQIWFLSFSNNYTQMGLHYESLFPMRFHYIVEDKSIAAQPLKEKNRAFYDIYQFGKLAHIPKKVDAQQFEKKLRCHIAAIALNQNENNIRELWLQDEWMQTFFRSTLRIGMYLTRLMHAWLQQTKPAMLVVANNGHEQYGLWAAKKYHIRTVLLQHGVLGDYYQFVDWPVDHYLVRGQFWQNFLMSSAKSRSMVINPFSENPKNNKAIFEKQNYKRTIIYFSLFYPDIEKQTRFCEERDSLLLTLAEAAIENNTNLIIRFHPRDKIAIHKKYIQSLYEKNNIDLQVQYSHEEKMTDVLKNAAVAVMYFSTVFLECLPLNIPMITYDWLNFPHKKWVESYQLFYFAKDLQSLKQLISKAVRSELPASDVNKQYFLDNTDRNDAKEQIKKLLHSEVA